MTDLSSLIAALEGAKAGDIELDGWIVASLWPNRRGRENGFEKKRIAQSMKFYAKHDPNYLSTVVGSFNVPKYTTSADAARGLSNWVLLYASDIGADGLALVKLGNPSVSPSPEVTGVHSHLIMAWVIAALRAREAEESSND